jgi:hypothetical protein
MPVLSVLIIIIMCPDYGACCSGAVFCSFVKIVDDTRLQHRVNIKFCFASKEKFWWHIRNIHYIYEERKINRRQFCVSYALSRWKERHYIRKRSNHVTTPKLDRMWKKLFNWWKFGTRWLFRRQQENWTWMEIYLHIKKVGAKMIMKMLPCDINQEDKAFAENFS